MLSIIRNYSNKRSPISHKYLNHGTTIELIWTITPALILILIAFPSFKRAPRETTSENNKYIGAGDNFGYLPPNNAYIKPNKILYGIAVVESPECAGLPRHKLGISGGNMTRFTNSIYSLIGYRRPTSFFFWIRRCFFFGAMHQKKAARKKKQCFSYIYEKQVPSRICQLVSILMLTVIV
jgi:hypothetical protein